MKRPHIKTVEMLQISAALAASLRWAIALMPLDGKQFSLTSRDWYEPVSFALSMFFVVVEIGATAYIMRAWRRESNTKTRNGLMLLWVVALVMMTVTQVPPVIANMDGVSVGTFPLWLKVIYATCGVAVTFVVIGGVGYAEKSLETQAAPQVRKAVWDDCHCPICYSVIGLPVWLHEQHGDKYIAYCDKCQRAYTESEVVWLPVGAQVGASVPQPDTPGLDKPAQPDSNLSSVGASGPEKPALLRPTSPKAPRAHAPSRDLTDFDVLKLWRAHGQADAWQQVSDIVSECLNGNTPDLKAWYDGKRSIAGLTTALGMDAAQAKRTGALVRGLIKPSEDQKVIDTDSK